MYAPPATVDFAWSLAGPSMGSYFLPTLGQDIAAHPFAYALKAGEIGSVLTPLPEALGAYEGVKAVFDVGSAAADLIYSLEH